SEVGRAFFESVTAFLESITQQGTRGMSFGNVAAIRRKIAVISLFALTLYTSLSLAPFVATANVFVLHNDALELTLEIVEGQPGRVRLLAIRDIVFNRHWLSTPSPLFEFSAYGQVWRSDGGLVVESLTATLPDRARVVARTPDRRLTFEINIAMAPGNGIAMIGGSVKNEGKDWFGPFYPGDPDPAPKPVFPADAHLALVRRDNSHEEALIVGFDGIVYATEENNDGPWSIPKALYATDVSFLRNLFRSGAPIAA